MIKEYTEQNKIKLLSTITRKTDITSYELTIAHQELGEEMAYKIIEDESLDEVEINHVQGKKMGFGFDSSKIAIVVLMRGGLFFGLGFRKVFRNSTLVLSNSVDDINLDDLTSKKVILVDSVINSGKSIINYVEFLQSNSINDICVSTIVMHEGAKPKLKDFVDCYVARISANYYVGKGSTDTGNRLFNSK